MLDFLPSRPIPTDATDERFVTADVWARVISLFTQWITTETGPATSAIEGLEEVARTYGIEGGCLLELSDGDEPFVVRMSSGNTSHEQLEILCRQARRTDRDDHFRTLPQVTSIWRPSVGMGIALTGDFPSRHLVQPLLEAMIGIASSMRERRGFGTTASPPDGRLVWPCDRVRGRSPIMSELYRQMEALAGTDLPILVHGETGTGKEGIARALHDSSDRCHGPFVAINCAAIPRELLEAELFGIADGVATGVRSRPGKFAEADGGTLFLDEIGDMPLGLQAKLLRVLQERRVEPLGGESRPVDFRLLSATHGDIGESMEAGGFRRDLYYRIAGSTLQVPALRHRGADTALFIEAFLVKFSDPELGIPTMTAKAHECLMQHDWPGNIRELENEVRRLVALARPGQPIACRDLSPVLGPADTETPSLDADPEKAPDSQTSVPAIRPFLAESLDLAELQKTAIRRALELSNGHRGAAAEMLGISRWALRRRLREEAFA